MYKPDNGLCVGGETRVRVTLRLTVSLSWCRAPSGAHDQIFILIESYSPVHMGRPL
jgi:hypothetical protein